MIVNLYGDGGLFFNMLAKAFKEAHLESKLKFSVTPVDEVGAKFKDAVKKTYNAKFLDDADVVLRFAEPNQSPVEEKPDEEGEGEQQADGQENTGGDENSGEDSSKEKGEDGGEKADTNEAETTATGLELKKKIVETVSRCFFEDDKQKVEVSDLDGYLEGYDVYFVKLSIKEKKEEA